MLRDDTYHLKGGDKMPTKETIGEYIPQYLKSHNMTVL